jgi:hypothetical protein
VPLAALTVRFVRNGNLPYYLDKTRLFYKNEHFIAYLPIYCYYFFLDRKPTSPMFNPNRHPDRPIAAKASQGLSVSRGS